MHRRQIVLSLAALFLALAPTARAANSARLAPTANGSFMTASSTTA